MNINIVYAKMRGMNNYKAVDLREGNTVDRIIYATMVEDTPRTREQLQEIADQNKDLDLSLQMRYNGKVIFQTR